MTAFVHSPRRISQTIYVCLTCSHSFCTARTIKLCPSALLSAKIVKYATLKTYPGYFHGMCTVVAEKINKDLRAFLKTQQSNSQRRFLRRCLRHLWGASFAKPSAAHELAAHVMGVKSFELPGEPSGVERDVIGQLPSDCCVATRKSIPRRISGRSAV